MFLMFLFYFTASNASFLSLYWAYHLSFLFSFILWSLEHMVVGFRFYFLFVLPHGLLRWFWTFISQLAVSFIGLVWLQTDGFSHSAFPLGLLALDISFSLGVVVSLFSWRFGHLFSSYVLNLFPPQGVHPPMILH